MRRNVMCFTLSALLFALSVSAEAQQNAKIPKIGFLGVRPDAANYSAKTILLELRKLGYVEGKTFTFEYRSAENQIDRLPALVDQLIRLKIDVLITAATRELGTAQKATREIPMVSLNLGDPVASGLVQSLARPGGNLTGFTPVRSNYQASGSNCSRKPFLRYRGLQCCGSANRHPGIMERCLERISASRAGAGYRTSLG